MKPISTNLSKTASTLAVVFTTMAGVAEIRIGNPEIGPNGLTLSWSNTSPGYTYTLQSKSDFAGGNWSNVWTRQYWPLTWTNWTEPTRLLTNRGMFRVKVEPLQTPNRGKILSSIQLREFPLGFGPGSVGENLNGGGWPTAGMQWAVRYYKLVYETVDPYGQPIVASGGLFVPIGTTNTLPLLSDQHGTQIYRPVAPSQDNENSFAGKLIFASSGYVTAAPDYLGLGESPGLHPYHHADTMATAIVDMLRAVKTFCASNSIPLNEQLFLIGYSEGGYATAAAHRAIERDYTNEFSITASAPMAGAYDTYETWQYFLHDAPAHSRYPHYAVFLIASAYQPIYGLADTLEELLAPPYNELLPPLYDGNHPGSEPRSLLPTDIASVLETNFYNAIIADPNHRFWEIVRSHALLDWAPQAPMRMYHCTGDEIVPYTNTVVALESYTTNGACCVEWIDPTPPTNTWTHGQCDRPSTLDAKAWFDTLKQ